MSDQETPDNVTQLPNRKARKTQAAKDRKGQTKPHQGLSSRVAGCEQSLGSLLSDLAKLNHNQQVIVSQFAGMEVQITVLVRLIVLQINAIRDVLNMPPLDFEEIEGLFTEFANLRQRSDWKNHLKTWYSGGDLSDLPEVPEPQEEAVEMLDPATALFEEDVVGSDSYLDVEDFGGDYGDERNQINQDPSGSLPEA